MVRCNARPFVLPRLCHDNMFLMVESNGNNPRES
jgi:hypothetical protein